MSPNTALRVARLAGGSAVFIDRRADGPVHVFAGRLDVSPSGALAVGARPLCGTAGKRWYLAPTIAEGTALCRRCDQTMRARKPRGFDVPDNELAALIGGARTSAQLDRTRAHILTPWRGELRAANDRGDLVTLPRLFAQARDRIRSAPARRERERLARDYVEASC